MQQITTCPNCGSQNTSGQQFCVSCGAHLGAAPRPVSHVPIVTGVATSSPLMTTPQSRINQTADAGSGQARQMDVKPTWGLAWGLFWRMIFLSLFTGGVLFLVYMLVRMALGYGSVFGPT